MVFPVFREGVRYWHWGALSNDSPVPKPQQLKPSSCQPDALARDQQSWARSRSKSWHLAGSRIVSVVTAGLVATKS